MVNDILKLNFNIIGVVVPLIEPYNDYDISNIDPSVIKLCLLKKDDKSLCIKNQSKMQIAKELNNDVIVLNDISKGLNIKEINYFNRLFLRLSKEYKKKIIIISRDIEFLFQICDTIAIYQDKVIYYTKDFYDDNLYKYIDMPKILRFIKLSNKKGAKLKNTKDINELIKDVYRRSNEIKSSNKI